jgi:hypothetical protein
MVLSISGNDDGIGRFGAWWFRRRWRRVRKELLGLEILYRREFLYRSELAFTQKRMWDSYVTQLFYLTYVGTFTR